MLYSGRVTQLTDKVHHIAPQNDSNIYKIVPYNIKLTYTKVDNLFIHLMMIIL